MKTLTKADWEILNATADDWENLEQIYQSICFDFSPEELSRANEGAFYLRPAKGASPLHELADRIYDLVQSGLLEARLEGSRAVTDLGDRSFVWRAWFRMTSSGRSIWANSEHAALV